MKQKNLLFVLAVLLCSFILAGSVKAQNNPKIVSFNDTQITMTWGDGNLFYVMPLNLNVVKPYGFYYQGKEGFPVGTRSQSVNIIVDNGNQTAPQIMVPGSNTWQYLTWDMLRCEDKDGKSCNEPQPTATPASPETEKCHWYHQWPCMSKTEKGVFIGIGVAAIVGGTLSITVQGGKGAKGAGDGGGIFVR